ncbi:MAG: hypothetical protein N4A45_04190 [Flavobacteriales bacterium]|jgi:hypothetical protein|nr:hypothetical protein [Flavobacteriales bacterium]
MKTKKNKYIAWIFTVLVHSLVLMTFWWFTFEKEVHEEQFGGIAVEFVGTPEKSKHHAKPDEIADDLSNKSQKVTQPQETSPDKQKILSAEETIALEKKKKEEKRKKEQEKNNKLFDDIEFTNDTQKSVSPDKVNVLSGAVGHNGDQEKSANFAKTGKGNNSGFFVGNRKPISNSRPPYKCQGNAVIVVEIVVSPNGKTVFARAGIEGSKYHSDCFRKEAYNAAMNTQWTANPKAKGNERGFIVYHFNTI